MNESKLTPEQLQQATTRQLPPQVALDTQTAALREGFLQFGRSVEAANDDFDEAALLAKLTRSCLGSECRPAVAPAKKRENNLWPLALTAALAASALFAIVRSVAVWQGPAEVVTVPPAMVQPDSAVAAQSPVIATDLPDTSALVAWSDPLDDEIASAQAAVESLTGRATGLDGSLESFGSRLEALSAELESGSL